MPTASVDFSDATSTQSLYAALAFAAAKACDSGMSNMQVAALDRRCAAKSLDLAVQKLGKSTLMAVHSEKTGRAAPAVVLASQ